MKKILSIVLGLMVVGSVEAAQFSLGNFLNPGVVLMVTNNTGYTNLSSLQYWPGTITNYVNTMYTNLITGKKVYCIGTNNFVAGTAPTGCVATTNDTTQLFVDQFYWSDLNGVAQPYSEAGKSATNFALASIAVVTGYLAQSNTVALTFVGVPDGVNEVTDPAYLFTMTVTNGYSLVSAGANGSRAVQYAVFPVSKFIGMKSIRLQSITTANAGAANEWPIYAIYFSGYRP